MFSSLTRLKWAWDLPYFYSNDIEHQYMLCEFAVSSNNLEALIWLRETKLCAWSPNIVSYAMYYGNTAIIEYIISEDEDSCEANSVHHLENTV